ncbi:MAG: sulfurtransferase TusA family protein [Bauldia litoralis]
MNTLEEHLLDATGLSCPLPILKTKKRLKDVPDGGLLRVLATDPGAVGDFHAFCEATGHTLLEEREEDGIYAFLLKKAG